MLTLTDEQIQVIKNGYKRVQVTVSFPFDNIPDITNEQIVYESLSFTESVCSSDVFRFGNAEASTVSFETVGVGNILGKVIDVKLTYEYILPEDPTNVRTFDLPYGRFTVTSCPRNHENMAHRQVQAVSRTSDTNDELMPQVEQDKLNSKYYSKNDYEPDVKYLLGSVNGVSSDYTTTFIADQSTALTEQTNIITARIAQKTNSHSGTTTLYEAYASYKVKVIDIENCLYTITGTHNTAIDDLMDAFVEGFSGGDLFRDNIKSILNATHLRISPVISAGYENESCYVDFRHLNHCYPYMNLVTNRFWIPYEVTLEIRENGTTISSATANPYPTFSVSKHTTTTDFPLTLAINHTLETSLTGVTYKQYSFANSYTMADIVTGYAELFAGFSRRNRDGSYSVVRLDNSNPYPLTASDVEGQAWWDEYSIADIGSIKYCWTDGKGDHEGEYTWNTDGSVYDMTDNGLFKNIKMRVKTVNALNKMTDHTMYYVYNDFWYAYNGSSFVLIDAYESKSSIIEYMLNTFFLPYADIHFTPIDMDIRGLSFLQCGDAITFTAADGTVIQSYILNHTFTGIQHITENIDTVQGEVLA